MPKVGLVALSIVVNPFRSDGPGIVAFTVKNSAGLDSGFLRYVRVAALSATVKQFHGLLS